MSGVLWSYSRHAYNMQSHDPTKPEVRWDEFPVQFFFVSNQLLFSCKFTWSWVRSSDRQGAAWNWDSFQTPLLHSPSVSNPVFSLTYRSGTIANTSYCCHSVLGTANGPREGSHLNQTIPCTQDGRFKTQRPNSMSGSAREATIGLVPCPSASETMAWMTTGRTKCT